MGRAPCCEKVGLRRGAWSPEEDQRLMAYVLRFGHSNWRILPKLAGLLRCGKSARLRWINYLRPDVKRGNFTKEEEQLIVKMHAVLGNKWSTIASYLPGRTDNEIKNHWNTYLKKQTLEPSAASWQNPNPKTKKKSPIQKRKACNDQKKIIDNSGLKPAAKFDADSSSDQTELTKKCAASSDADADIMCWITDFLADDSEPALCSTAPQLVSGGHSSKTFSSIVAPAHDGCVGHEGGQQRSESDGLNELQFVSGGHLEEYNNFVPTEYFSSVAAPAHDECVGQERGQLLLESDGFGCLFDSEVIKMLEFDEDVGGGATAGSCANEVELREFEMQLENAIRFEEQQCLPVNGNANANGNENIMVTWWIEYWKSMVEMQQQCGMNYLHN